jgi:biopolymer transport protein ExbB
MLNTIQQFLDACHPFGYPLLACSIILLTAIFYHLKVRLVAGNSVACWATRIINGKEKKEEYHKFLEELALKSPLLHLVHLAVINKDLPNLDSVIESKLKTLIEQSRAGMSTIAIITNIAPMLGILGTAWGLVDIFGVFDTPGAQEGIALGISKALYTTIFGLAIAVPGIIAQIYFERSLERQAAILNEHFSFLLAHRHSL